MKALLNLVAHASGKYISLETALDGITTPLHPGALKYYLNKVLMFQRKLDSYIDKLEVKAEA